MNGRKAWKKSSNVDPIQMRRRKETPYQQELRRGNHRISPLPGQRPAPPPNAAASPECTPWGSWRLGWNDAGAEGSASGHRPLSLQKVQEPGQDSKRQVLHRILSLARHQEAQLSSLLSKDPVSAGDLEEVARHRTRLLGHYERVILSDVGFSEVQHVSQALWKNAFHQVIERLGQLLRHPGTMHPEHVRSRLLAVLDEGTAFYQTLLEKLERRYRFQLAAHSDGLSLCSKPSEEPLKCALACAQRYMICLGDIARYREQARGANDFDQARSWYLKAQRIDPSDERPYNQLALLAVYTKRKLEAVCYFMRSSAAASASVCSQKNLTKLLAASARKAGERLKLARSSSLGGSAGDLEQSFIRSFLQAHGQLFTGIGMETFPAVADQVLQTFQLLLHQSPASLGSHQMLCLVAINIFAAHNSSQRQQTASAPRCPSIQGGATALGLAMFHLLLRGCTYWLQQCPRAPASPVEEEGAPSQIMVSSFSPALKALLPSVNICSQWLLVSRPTWNPPPTTLKPYPEMARDVWGTLEHLSQALLMVDTSEVPLSLKPGKGLTLLILEEDQLFSGFAPFGSTPPSPCFLKANSDEVVAGNCRRVTVLKDLLEALCRQEKALQECEDGPGQGSAPAADLLEEKTPKLRQRRLGRREDGKEFPGDSLLEGGGVLGSAIRELEAKKLVLAQRIAEEQRRQEKIQAILEASTQERQREEEIRPGFLVLDTNSFIQHLESLSKLLEERKHILLVPLIVIHELNGLAKGQQGDEQTGLHSSEDSTQQLAQKTLDFLEQQFKLSNPHLKALSSHGAALETSGDHRRGMLSQQGNNDDHILACCLNYQRAQAKNTMPAWRNKPSQAQPRGLVLLTDDRTLRVKALACNVPVWDNATFLQEMKTLLQCPPLPPLEGQQQVWKRWRPALGL